MKAVFKKDFLSLFHGVVGWLFLGINLFVYGLYFFAYNLSSGLPSISNTLSAIAFILLITVPILTMRSMSEEKKNRTDQLLLTSPVSVWKLVIGKFLSVACVHTIVCGVIALSPLFLSIFGKAALKESYTALFGFWLYGLTCIAIGVLMSSFTESQMIAAILTIAVLFLGYMMTAITSLFSTNTKWLATILNVYDLNTPYQNFISGIFEISSVVYFVSVIFLCLFLTIQVVQKRRWTVSTKQLTTGAFSIISIIVCVAIVIGANVGASKIPSRYRSIDMTKQKYYSVTKATKKYLKSLDQDVTIYVLNTKSQERAASTLSSGSASVPYSGETVLKTLDNYSGNKHVTVKFVNPTKNPTFASNYTDESLLNGSLIVVNDKTNKARAINATDLFSYQMNSSYTGYTMTAYDGEGQITSALQYVTSDSEDKIYFVSGHGETELGSSFTEYITKSNMDSDTINLRTNKIPDDCTILVINGPITDLSEDEVKEVKDYIDDGGKALLSVNMDSLTSGDSTPNYLALLKDYGVSASYGLVEDQDTNHTAANYPWLLYPDVNSSDVTKGIQSSPSVCVPYAAGMTTGADTDDTKSSYDDFLTTSASAEMIDPSTGEAMDTGDTPTSQSYVLGTMVSTDGKTANLCVLSSSYMLIDDVESFAPGQNTTLFKNILSEFGSEDSGKTVSIAKKSYTYSNLQFTARAVVVYGFLWGIILPLILIAVGIVIWAFRRRK